eukprot:jgi/Botrbrau1/12325/Bobra.0205s0023.1
MNIALGRIVLTTGLSRNGGSSRSSPRRLPGTKPCRAEDGKNNGAGKTVVNEDVLQRLRAAEAEAAKLREELAAAKAQSQGTAQAESAESGPKRRIDGGGLRREGIFPATDDWLNESEVSGFVTGGGPTESPSTSTPEEQEVVKRRLIIGVLATAGLGAFALVPTDYLRLGRPSKPLFLLLVPLVRIQSLLKEIEGIVADGRWAELETALQRIQGPPNDLEQKPQRRSCKFGDGGRKRESPGSCSGSDRGRGLHQLQHLL